MKDIKEAKMNIQKITTQNTSFKGAGVFQGTEDQICEISNNIKLTDKQARAMIFSREDETVQAFVATQKEATHFDDFFHTLKESGILTENPRDLSKVKAFFEQNIHEHIPNLNMFFNAEEVLKKMTLGKFDYKNISIKK